MSDALSLGYKSTPLFTETHNRNLTTSMLKIYVDIADIDTINVTLK